MFQVYYFDLAKDKFIKHGAPCPDNDAAKKLRSLRKNGWLKCHAKEI